MCHGFSCPLRRDNNPELGSEHDTDTRIYPKNQRCPALLSHVIERNIRTITRLRLQTAHERQVQDRLADHYYLLFRQCSCVHPYLLVGAWLLGNTGHAGYRLLTPSPAILTMIVSLEAIFLSTFVLISQNRFSDERTAVRVGFANWAAGA